MVPDDTTELTISELITPVGWTTDDRELVDVEELSEVLVATGDEELDDVDDNELTSEVEDVSLVDSCGWIEALLA